MTPPADPTNRSPFYPVQPAEKRAAKTDGGGDADEAAAYIAGAASDLAGMARRHGLKTLGFLLDMVQLEAEEHARLRLLQRLK